MNCNKCNSLINKNEQFCGNCGNKINKPKRKIFKIIIISLILLFAFCGILLLILFLTKDKKEEMKDPFSGETNEMLYTKAEYKEIVDVRTILKKDYEEKNITSDEYIMQLAYSIYEPNSLYDKYKNNEINNEYMGYLLEETSEVVDELSLDTLYYVLNKSMLSNVKWEESKVKPTSFEEIGDVNYLTNAILSENGNFIIYYSTKGLNKTTKENAQYIADLLEEVVISYKVKYGFDFKYDANVFTSIMYSDAFRIDKFGTSFYKNIFESQLLRANAILKKEKIDVSNINTAMPIYLTNLEETGGLCGQYTSNINMFFSILVKAILKIQQVECKLGTNDLSQEECIISELNDNLLGSVYSLPFFIVNSNESDFDNLKIIASHELFHHYQYYICGDGEYKTCKSDLFTKETTANLAASDISKTNKMNTLLNGHASVFVNSIGRESIEKIGNEKGYYSFVFAHNYSRIVPNGINILFNSMKNESTLNYIYENSNGKYKDAFVETAIKNMTLDYDNKLYVPTYDGKIVYPENARNLVIENEYKEEINYSTMKYYYINSSDYNESSQIVFKKSNDKNLTLLLFGFKNNKYEYLYKQDLDKDFVINPSEFEYFDEIVFSVVNSNISGTIGYNIKVLKEGTDTPSITAEELDIPTLVDELKNKKIISCDSLQDDEDFSNYIQFKIYYDDEEMIDKAYAKATIVYKDYIGNESIYNFSKNIVLIIFKYAVYINGGFKDVYLSIDDSNDGRINIVFELPEKYFNQLEAKEYKENNSKYNVIKYFKEEGFTCELK